MLKTVLLKTLGSHAIEFDFGSNWAEAIGQSSYYSRKKKGTGTLCSNVKTSEIKDWKFILDSRYEFLLEIQIQKFSFEREDINRFWGNKTPVKKNCGGEDTTDKFALFALLY